MYKLTLRHGGNTKMKSNIELSSELSKEIANECLECPFNMSFREEIVDYCLNECPGGRRDMVNVVDSELTTLAKGVIDNE